MLLNGMMLVMLATFESPPGMHSELFRRLRAFLAGRMVYGVKIVVWGEQLLGLYISQGADAGPC